MKPIKHFSNGQRVKVIQVEHPCLGLCGTVVRLRRADRQAWVDMDDDLPGDLRCFPADDEHGRGNHMLLWPDECCEETVKTRETT